MRAISLSRIARQTVVRDAVAHHAARRLGAVDDVDRMAHAREVVRGGEARRARAYDQDALPGRGGLREGPALFERMVPEEAFDRIDADRFVDLTAVAGAFARVVAHAPHRRREGVVFGDLLPGALVVAALGVEEPGLALLARGALRVAGRQAVHVDGFDRTPRTGSVGKRRTDVERDGERFVHGGLLKSGASVPRPVWARG